nr:MerR family transcriptional regulator [Actinomycetota bacterium]
VLERLDSGLPVPEVDPPSEPVSDAAAPPAPPGPALEGRPVPSVAGTGAALRPGGRPTVRMTPAELRSATGLDIPTYSALTTFGLLRLDPAGRHGGDDLDVARAAAALAAYGIEARHLRLFRVAADREIGLAEQVLEPLRRRRARGAPGADPEEAQAQVLAHGLALHTALVRSGLSRPG